MGYAPDKHSQGSARRLARRRSQKSLCATAVRVTALRAASPESTAYPMTRLGAAVLMVLHGLPLVAIADDKPSDKPSDELAEVTVTASRRQQTIEDVPYAIAVVNADELERTGVTDLASLSRQVPGLNLTDFGARYSAATVPIIRGINAGDVVSQPQVLVQAPVGIYINNSPVTGYFQLDDIERIEVLEGPQGTLYGAGSLGGSIRIIPNKPELGEWSGKLMVGGSTTAHSNGDGKDASGVLNAPLGDTLALRIAAKYEYDPGFINVYGILQRPGPTLTGIPTLANPAEPVTSEGIFTGINGWNFQKTLTTRTSLYWKPNEIFNADLAFTYANVQGDGGPVANTAVTAGPYPIDPRVTFPSGGPYQMFSGTDEPFTRNTGLTSLDLSLDVGFATLSSTSSYYANRGTTYDDYTYTVFSFAPFQSYYTGNPVNPRFVGVQEFSDSDKTFTQEVRLVSKPAPDRPLDYVAGVFFEKQDRDSFWGLGEPGTREYSLAQGCTAPYVYGAPFPNCISVKGPDDIGYDQDSMQEFKDKSVYGELTWHFNQQTQITFGGRHFDQDFTDGQSYNAYPFFLELSPVNHSTTTSANIWKINPSYEYAEDQHLYATWSQGFRRGGANAIVTGGILKESSAIEYYQPDKTNNYEVGFKGRIDKKWSYSLGVFDIQWDKPQISTVTPYTLEYVVVNGNKAESKGVELESNGSLLVPGFSYNLAFTYADAKLTQPFSLPANNGTGAITPGLISGTPGEQLPGSPKESGALTINYEVTLAPTYTAVASFNSTFTGNIRNGLPNVRNPYTPLPSYVIDNFSLSLNHQHWQLIAYTNNLTDKRAIIAGPAISTAAVVGPLVDANTINRPRQIGVKIGYSF
jgi:iron complex outermembrane recepter protein